MHRGAVVMVDALGFKGIWRRHQSSDIIAKLHNLSESINAHLDRGFHGDRAARLKVNALPGNSLAMMRATFLSDTIVICIAFRPATAIHAALQGLSSQLSYVPSVEALAQSNDRLAVDFAMDCIAILPQLATCSTPHLTYRGVVTLGDFDIDDDGRFLVGPAVDDAAQNHELAQGAFVWLAPSAMKAGLLGKPKNLTTIPAPIWHAKGVDYEVPLKNGLTYPSIAITPFGDCTTEQECETLRQSMLATFDTDITLDVQVKRHATNRFLAAALAQWHAENLAT